MGILALALGILSIILPWFYLSFSFFGFAAPVLALGALFLGIMGMKNNTEPRGLFIGGLVTGIIGLVVSLPIFYCACQVCRLQSAAKGALGSLGGLF